MSVGGGTEETIKEVVKLVVLGTGIRCGAVIEALQTKKLLQILAEPNLIAVNGKEASFLAGGQFPFPLVQPGQGFTAVSNFFKKFSGKLEFTPLIITHGNNPLQVSPHTSSPHFLKTLSTLRL